MKSSEKYLGSIEEIGLNPFFVHFCTTDQLRVWNKYCQTEYARVVIDASGNVADSLTRPGGLKSGHLFFYCGVSNIPGGGEGQIPMLQMLSERHNANAIAYWLAEWRRRGATLPDEVVVDDSAALISAVCKALADSSSTAEYISNCFRYLQGDESLKPRVLVRLDVAHLTKMIRSWKEISTLRARAKEFYVRCIILSAKAPSLEEARSVLYHIIVTAYSETEGISNSSGEPTASEVSKKYLLGLIADYVDAETTRPADSEEEQATSNLSFNNFEDLTRECQQEDLKEWMEAVETECMCNVSDDGDRDNLMFNVPIIKRIKDLVMCLPLWSRAMSQKFGSPFERGVGASVESEFNNLKNRLIHGRRRVDDFVKEYLDLVDGTIKIASSMPFFQDRPESPCNRNLDSPAPVQISPRGPSPSLLHASIRTPRSSPISGNQDMTHSSVFPGCPPCRDGNLPTGAHTCMQCGEPVHLFCSTAAPGQSEGYGEKRICWRCQPMPVPSPLKVQISERFQSLVTRALSFEVDNPGNFRQFESEISSEMNRNATSERIIEERRNSSESHLHEAIPEVDLGQKENSPPSQDLRQPNPTPAPSTSTLKQQVVTSVLQLISENCNALDELRSVEPWRGKSLPPKKRQTGYYWRNNPDFPSLLDIEEKTKVGVLRNGGVKSLKSQRVNRVDVSLLNTCSFDAPCQILAAAYCDSPAYREKVEMKDVTGSMLEIAVQMATKGVKAAVYKKRAKLLFDRLEGNKENLAGGLVRVNCKMDSSALVRQVMWPSTIEVTSCSSDFCPDPEKAQEVVVISTDMQVCMLVKLSLTCPYIVHLICKTRKFNTLGNYLF
jgi:hypothetical protein